jgi:hypothetical protein
MNIPKIVYVCVNFNGFLDTTKFIESVFFQVGNGEFFELECVVVDNTPDMVDSKDLLRILQEKQGGRYIASPDNLGYFGGLNHGLSLIPMEGVNFVVVGNNDLIFDPQFTLELIKQKYEPRVMVICPDVVTKDGVHQNPHVLKRIGFFRRLRIDLYFSNYYVAQVLSKVMRIVSLVKAPLPPPRQGCEIHMGIGACYVLGPLFLKNFKRLVYPFFLFGEEAYISKQVHSKCGILWFEPRLQVYHQCNASLSKIPKRIAYNFARDGYPSYRKLL